jgi:hypothetical protein
MAVVAASPVVAATVLTLRSDDDMELAARLTINGRSAWFMFDSGAGVHTFASWFAGKAGLALDAELAKAMSVKDSTGQPVPVEVAAPQVATLPDGSTVALPPAVIAAFPEMFEELELGGLINPQLLADEDRAVVLDLRVPELRFEPYDDAVRRLGATTFLPSQFETCRDAATPIPNLLYVVEVETGNGRAGRMQLDSGADRSSIVASSALVHGLDLKPGGETMGIGGRRQGVLVAADLPLGLGPHRVTLDAAVVDSSRGACGPDGLLGRDALGRCAIVFAPDRLAIACGESAP